MNNTETTSGEDYDEFLYMMVISRDGLNASSQPEGPIDRRIFYCKPWHGSRKVFEEAISKGGTSVLPKFGG